jgi:hypothetical protein
VIVLYTAKRKRKKLKSQVQQYTPVILVLERLKDNQLVANLGYIVRPCLKKQKKKK